MNLFMLLSQFFILSSRKKEYDLFPHFATRLYKFHLKIENPCEAAETLVWGSKCIKWTDTTDHPRAYDFEPEKANERKENMLKKALWLFNKCLFYDRGLEVIQELKAYYVTNKSKFLAMRDILNEEVNSYSNVYAGERNQLNQFYGVEYHGDDFSPQFREKIFVYRRHGFFRNDEMLQKLTDKFPFC